MKSASRRKVDALFRFSECWLGRFAEANFLVLGQLLIHDHEIATVPGLQLLVGVQHFNTVNGRPSFPLYGRGL
jgi:hypothetical protein